MRLFLTLWGASLRSRMQYKGNFLFSSFSYGMIMLLDFLLLAAILYRFDHILGWTIAEVGLLYSISTISMSLYRLLAPEIHNFDTYLIQGDFDTLLIRPVSPLTLLLTRNLDLSRLGGIVQGIGVLCLSLALMWGVRDLQGLLLYLPITLLSGTAILFSLGLITATLAFWSERTRDFQSFTLYAPSNAASYPMSVYTGWIKWLFFTILPVAYMGYVPVAYLLHKGGSWHGLWLSPLIALLSILIALHIWHIGIRHYRSTGS
ncbi:ABC transporter permease [Mechercharimyces sp. CAU 1602]|uniref:ABC transporter permease n=1 Tax=Mechercharimyces sp. CAU 1602 TaxID=2973933 RepID=UPI0021622247|nr:ABC-2 family transporter protein [Mechercharimyces sp. CAU 1602]MCS1352091.1 ABC-2 family transporter protein [Mechercharimyces sp. CAU 1602]